MAARGNSGIEHRQPETVLQAYRHWGLPNYAVYAGGDQRDCYEGGNNEEGETQLASWLNMIADNGTATVYTLKVYSPDIKDIISKSPHKGSTTFALSEPGTVTRGNDGVVVVNGSNGMGNTGGNNALMQQIAGILEGQKQLIGTITQVQQQQKEDKWDKILAALMEQKNAPAPEPHWLEKLALVICEKPEVIDRVGYIFRPELYTHQTPISGVSEQKKVEDMAQVKEAPPVELTPEEVEALNDRIYAALETMSTRWGLKAVTEMMEAVSKMSDGKVNALKAFM